MLALILGIVGLFVPGVGILAVVLGRKDPSQEARAGVLLGWVGIVLTGIGCCVGAAIVAVTLSLPSQAQPEMPEISAPTVPTVAPVPQTGFLGIRCDDSTGSVAVSEVIPDSPAATAGLQEGDVIVQIAERKVDSCDDLAAVVRQRPGETVLLIIRRDGEIINLTVVLGQR